MVLPFVINYPLLQVAGIIVKTNEMTKRVFSQDIVTAIMEFAGNDLYLSLSNPIC
ncbi:MAG: hypothetical protein ACXVLT_16240 [Flavisolibacter sp.]